MESIKKSSLMLDNYALASIQDVPLEHLKNSSIFISGATGLIGSALVRALLMANKVYNTNIKVIASARNIENLKEKFRGLYEEDELYFLKWDLNDDISCEFSKIDYAIHAAAMTSSKDMISKPVEVMTTTFDGACRFLKFVKDNPQIKKAVILSSMEVYGSVQQSMKSISENQYGHIDVLAVRSSYPISKRAVECLAKSFSSEYCVPVCLARLAQTFGVGVNPIEQRVFAEFARHVVFEDDIILRTDGKTEHNYCALSDAVRAIIYLLEKGEKGEAYNVASKYAYSSIYEMAQIFSSFSNTTTKVVVNKENVSQYGYAPETKLKLDTQKLESLGFYSKKDLKTMVEEVVEWFKILREEGAL